jgi:hypothetical protein
MTRNDNGPLPPGMANKAHHQRSCPGQARSVLSRPRHGLSAKHVDAAPAHVGFCPGAAGYSPVVSAAGLLFLIVGAITALAALGLV